jgi:hypothetical protein
MPHSGIPEARHYAFERLLALRKEREGNGPRTCRKIPYEWRLGLSSPPFGAIADGAAPLVAKTKAAKASATNGRFVANSRRETVARASGTQWG